MVDVKAKIKSLMHDRGLTVYALSQKSDLSQACIANWYNERNYEPSVDALQKICAGLNITMAELFCDKDDEMYPVDNDTKELLNTWHRLSSSQRHAVTALLKSFIVID